MMIKRIIKHLLKFKPIKKHWYESQKYELDHAMLFMKTPEFHALASSTHSGEFKMSKGYVSDLMLREFFNGDHAEWNKFTKEISNKKCLEIGPSVYSPLAWWDVASERHVVEPLIESIEQWQKENMGYSVFEGLNTHPHGAEVLLQNLIGKIDGAIYCRNCIDHSPHWTFILANISKYASPGCRLLLWADLDHHGEADEGHYDITTDVPAFRRLVELFGFDVLREYEDENRKELNWGCYAIKRPVQ